MLFDSWPPGAGAIAIQPSRLISWATVIMYADAQFNMYPAVESMQLASSLGFSVEFLSALYVFSNLYAYAAEMFSRITTVTCDPDLFRMTGQVDLYFWDQENLTDLCTGSCIQSASDWLEAVYGSCNGQTFTIDSKMVPTESVAIRYSDGLGTACLTDKYGPSHKHRT